MSSSGSSWPGTVDLSQDTWVFQAEWDTRPDDLPSCTERLLACLTEVAGLDPSLARWHYDDELVPLDEPSLGRRLADNWDRETPSGAHGSIVPLWNGMRDDHTMATITVTCGASASYLHNGVEFVPPRPAAVPDLYRLDTMLGLFDSMISAWQPRWCRIRPRSLRDATHHGTVDILASWIVYLDHGLPTRTGVLPSEISTINRADGEVFVLAPTPEQLRLNTIDRLREHITFPGETRLG